MQVPKTHREVRPAYGVPEIGTISNGTGNVCERRKRELLVGFGGMMNSQTDNTPYIHFIIMLYHTHVKGPES